MPPKFIARQPILDSEMRVFAYELLFRDDPANASETPAQAASNVVVDSITLSDLQVLTGSALAFVNVDEMALRLGAGRLLPPDRMVVEILETVRPTKEIVDICRALRADGYQIALDDFLDEPKLAPLVELAQFLKVDFQQSNSLARENVARKYRGGKLALLAEKVETRSEMEEARSLGFTYFQGYFFSKPSTMAMPDISGNKRVLSELLNVAVAPDSSLEAVAELMEQEPSLLYRFLRFLNSPAAESRPKISSIRQATRQLGDSELRRRAAEFALLLDLESRTG
jgi:c-di-GMP-related signal transduction protein